LDDLSGTVHELSFHTVDADGLEAYLYSSVLFSAEENAASVRNHAFIFGKASVRDGSILFKNAVSC